MGGDAFDRQVNRIWANHFGCTVEALQVPGTTLLPRETMRGQGVVHIATIRSRALVEIDPLLEADLRFQLAPSGGLALTGAMLRGAWVLLFLRHVGAAQPAESVQT
jgi:hypothetical protein